ncbi:MAG: hypothetical protein GXX83_05380 [Gaiellales bacterium]|nr:hypothetical protein [Gaiellales bacterium]
MDDPEEGHRLCEELGRGAVGWDCLSVPRHDCDQAEYSVRMEKVVPATAEGDRP